MPSLVPAVESGSAEPDPSSLTTAPPGDVHSAVEAIAARAVGGALQDPVSDNVCSPCLVIPTQARGQLRTVARLTTPVIPIGPTSVVSPVAGLTRYSSVSLPISLVAYSSP